MRRILIQTEQPWLHRGYMVVGVGLRDGVTKLRLECRTIDSQDAADNRRTEILSRDHGLTILEISEVRR